MSGAASKVTWSSAEMLRASAAAAKAAADGSMWGRSVFWSEILSMSKKRLPGMRLALNSSLGSLPAVPHQILLAFKKCIVHSCFTFHGLIVSLSEITKLQDVWVALTSIRHVPSRIHNLDICSFQPAHAAALSACYTELAL